MGRKFFDGHGDRLMPGLPGLVFFLGSFMQQRASNAWAEGSECLRGQLVVMGDG